MVQALVALGVKARASACARVCACVRVYKYESAANAPASRLDAKGLYASR
jgi:hypothetical protein